LRLEGAFFVYIDNLLIAYNPPKL